MRLAHAVIAGLLLGVPGVHGGCGDDGSTSVDVPPPPPPTTGAVADTSTGDAASSTGDEPVACRSSDECSDGQVCVADFATGDPTPPSMFTCRAECVAPGAISRWCSDDSSCCEGTCGPDDGLCRLPDEGTGSSGSSGSGSSDSGSSGSGGSDSGSSGSSSGG